MACGGGGSGRGRGSEGSGRQKAREGGGAVGASSSVPVSGGRRLPLEDGACLYVGQRAAEDAWESSQT